MYWLHSPNPQVPSCIICFLARNSASLPASMLCSEHCFLACFYARNIASLPASVHGTLLLCLLLCSEHCFLLCIGCIAQIPRFRAVPSFLEPCFLARNSASLPASMLCSEHCCFACFYARNIASLPASVLGTLLPSMYARNPAFLPDPSALCLYLCSARNSASFNALLGTLLLCMFRASDYPCSLDY
jgi:hypothetical protein